MRKLYDKLFTALRKVKLFDKILSLPVIGKLAEYEVLTYLIFGVLTTVVNFVVYALCKLIHSETEGVMFTVAGLGFKWANLFNTIAWVAAVLFAYITNKFLVFESTETDKKGVIREIVSFFGARIISFLVFEQGIFSVLLHFGVNDFICKIITGILTIIFNYIASKLVIFKKGE